MKKQDQIIKNLVARTEALGGSVDRTDYKYMGNVTLDLMIGNSKAMVCIGPRGAFQYVSTWFEDRFGGYISVSDIKSRPSWAKAGDLRAWFWSVSHDQLAEEVARDWALDFHKTVSITFTDKMVAA